MAQGDKDQKKKKGTPQKNGVDPSKSSEADRAAEKSDSDEPKGKAAASASKDEAAQAKGHGAATAHGGHHPTRKEYLKIFGVLFVLTAIEVAVAKVPGIGKGALYVALIGLALAKAGCVALFYMHLKYETKVLKATVAVPFAAPAIYAIVLIAEAAYRLTKTW